MAVASADTRLGKQALSQPFVPKQRTHAAPQPTTPTTTRSLTGPLSMRWSTGPDGRLHCTWPTADLQPLLADRSDVVGTVDAIGAGDEPRLGEGQWRVHPGEQRLSEPVASGLSNKEAPARPLISLYPEDVIALYPSSQRQPTPSARR
jgi:hypothetical protein